MKYSQFIAGEFREGTAQTRYSVINPANGQSLGDYAYASRADVEEAVAAATEAFRTWRKTSAMERSALLRRAATLMRERGNTIAEQIARELGKPYGEAQKEVVTAAEMFEWASEEARRIYGRTIPARSEGITQTVVWEPMGPVAAFAGWNAPAITPSRKISGALAAGCTIVIKPSEETAGVALLIARVVQDAGIPDGVVNMVFGDPGEVADILCRSPRIAMVTFTGATSVGKVVGAKAAETMKRATLELGGHAPVVVCDDVDVDRVVRMAVATKYRNSGQVCTSPTRFLIQAPIFQTFCEKFVRAAEALKVGDPFDSATQMGPLKNARRLEAIDRMVQDARGRGLVVATGGERAGTEGFFYKPTVILQPSVDSDAATIEPFGPIAMVSSFDQLDDAIAEANRLPFGLAAYAYTNSLQRAHRLSQEIDSGVVCINEWQASLPETPFGGHKDSGLGSEGGIEGIQEFLRIKCVRQGVAS
ncbi:NAD-dependent succinate-semialdehyde dehydrogenase [Cupriavidus metallidurans]|uniref:NAD-dependent succinate-semialdehyde dehydrogenase n=1 Tax=Cupriavidus TaxID=106589 RepID=UPI0002A1F8FD|nr:MULTISPECIES: NAD-dependent succinate-semialdehyde dehydrogenase [Cupriavidus]ELA01315.1 aldehyde dehydrogenase [Cupriavidus sp. HMR-1]GMG92382.1 NAD-dependent succinate-semialdehyde dehydrogenase [Cupriavidus sp. TKC]HBD33300.1 NAD-dependent succinate-semialdehyde dehydrogenase [Cupriavidus sp.]